MKGGIVGVEDVEADVDVMGGPRKVGETGNVGVAGVSVTSGVERYDGEMGDGLRLDPVASIALPPRD